MHVLRTSGCDSSTFGDHTRVIGELTCPGSQTANRSEGGVSCHQSGGLTESI
jgi:hypothetical protein